MKTLLIEKYLRGETSTPEEQQLLGLLEAEAQPTADDLALKAMLKAAPPQAESDWLTEDESALYDQLLLERQAERRTRPLWTRVGIGIAAVAVLAIGLTLALALSRPDRESAEAVAYVYGREVKDQREVLALMESTMQGLMGGEESGRVEDQLNEIFGK